jgi:hypothetical protein
MTLDRDACPSQDLLIEAAAPGASTAVRERLADHLITCAECTEEFRVLQALGPWASEHASTFAEATVDRPAFAEATAGRDAFTKATGGKALRWAYAAAAVLAIAAAGLAVEVRRLTQSNQLLEASVFAKAAADRRSADLTPPNEPSQEARLADQQRQIGELEQKLRAAEAPDLNPPIIDLEAADSLRSGTSTTRATIPGDARHVVFVLNTASVRPGAAFEVDIVDADNRVVWTGSGLKQSADGTLTLMIPRPMVTPSSRVRLYSRAGTPSRRALVEEYVLPARR